MPRTLSVEEYKELGKRYYSRKDYQRALGAFTDGIDASVGRDIQLYDYRAAVYDKLEDGTSALADARHMIKAYESDPRGYLRAGQLLLKMDKKQQALQIYARGLRYVPATNSQLNLLRGAHDKLNRELCPPKAIDPFTQLPIEIVEIIMSYLRFAELVSCLRVSKQWNLFLSSLPQLWTSMDLLRAGTRRAVKPSFVKTCMRLSQNKLTYARIANFGHRGILQNLVTQCSRLEVLEFVLTPLGGDSILEAVVPARSLKKLIVHADMQIHGDTMSRMLKHRPTLEELRVYNLGQGCTEGRAYNFQLPNLRILDLREVHQNFIGANHLSTLISSAPNLREFIFEDLSPPLFPVRGEMAFVELKHLEVLRIVSESFTGFPRASTTLRDLDYQFQKTWHPFANSNMVVPNGFPRLERLRIRNFQESLLPLLDPYHGNEENDIPDQATLLKAVAISCVWLPNWSDVEAVLVHERLREVEELSLEGMTAAEMDDGQVGSIVQLKHLRRLHLDHAVITGIGIKALVTGLKSTLKHLTLTACDSLGRDAIDWVARQGIAITLNEGGLKNKNNRQR